MVQRGKWLSALGLIVVQACVGDPALPFKPVPSGTAARVATDDTLAARAWRRSHRGRLPIIDRTAPPSFINYAFVSVPVVSAWGLDVRKDGVTAVTSVFDSSLAFLNAKTFAVLGVAPTTAYPTAVDFEPEGKLAYVASQGMPGQPGMLDIFDVATRTKIGFVAFPGESPISVLVRRLQPFAFVGLTDGNVALVDLTTRQVVRRISVGGPINGLAIDSTETHLYATDSNGGSMVDIDVPTFSTSRKFVLGGVPQGVAVSRNGTLVVVANEVSGQLDVVNVGTAVVTHLPFPGAGFGIADAPMLNRMFIVDAFGQIFTYDVLLGLLSQPVVVSNAARRAALHPSSRTLVVTNSAGQVIFVR